MAAPSSLRTATAFWWRRTFSGWVSSVRARDRAGAYDATVFHAEGSLRLRLRFTTKDGHESILHVSDHPNESTAFAVAYRELEAAIEKCEGGRPPLGVVGT